MRRNKIDWVGPIYQLADIFDRYWYIGIGYLDIGYIGIGQILILAKKLEYQPKYQLLAKYWLNKKYQYP